MSLFAPTDTTAPRNAELLSTTPRYEEAQATVDELSDHGFPVERLRIVWDGLRRIEHVTGRVTTWRAAGQGAVAGAWFGGILGWLFAIFSTEAFLAVFLTYLVVGAVAGAIWKGIGHAMQRGRRDFDTVPSLAAEEYQIWCDADLLAEAQRIVGTTSGRAMDPDDARR